MSGYWLKDNFAGWLSVIGRLTPADPLTLAIAVVTLLVAAAMAGFLPARRASGIDPMVALRYE